MAWIPTRIETSAGGVAAYGAVGGPCLLVHGAGEDASIFAALVADLDGVWAVDLPGHGRSAGTGFRDVADYRDLVLDVIRRHAPEGVCLGGHSMGGAIALSAALAEPGLLHGLVLIATGGRLRVHPDLLAALEGGEMPQAFLDMMFAPGAPDEARAALPAADPLVQYGDFLACDAFDVLGRLGEIRMRSLVLVGDRDRMTPEKHGRRLAEAIGGRLEVIPGAGHMLPLEAPRELSQAIGAFLAGGAR